MVHIETLEMQEYMNEDWKWCHISVISTLGIIQLLKSRETENMKNRKRDGGTTFYNVQGNH